MQNVVESRKMEVEIFHKCKALFSSPKGEIDKLHQREELKFMEACLKKLPN